MATNAETSFGDRLARGFQLQQAIAQMPTWVSPDDELKAPNFLNFLNAIDAKNNSVAAIKDEWLLNTIIRRSLFFDENGIKKRASYVLAYCKSRNDLKTETQLIKRIVRMITDYHKPTKEKSLNDEDKNKRNRGNQSYGDLYKLCGDLIEALKQVPEYTPANDLITLDKLETFRSELGTANQNVADKHYEYSIVVKEREEMYLQLKDKMLRIKQSVKSQFGEKSNEYQTVKGIRV